MYFPILLLTQNSSTRPLTLPPEQPCKRLFLVQQQRNLREWESGFEGNTLQSSYTSAFYTKLHSCPTTILLKVCLLFPQGHESGDQHYHRSVWAMFQSQHHPRLSQHSEGKWRQLFQAENQHNPAILTTGITVKQWDWKDFLFSHKV